MGVLSWHTFKSFFITYEIEYFVFEHGDWLGEQCKK